MQVFYFIPRSVLLRYTLIIIRVYALYFCDDVQLTQMFCMHVFTEGYAYLSYDMKLFDLFLAL